MAAALTISLSRLRVYRQRVERELNRKHRRALFRVGGDLRRTQQGLIRKRRSVSRAGTPPSQHLQARQSIKFILFAVEPEVPRVISGPVGFTSGANRGPQTVPNLLEVGGSVRRRVRRGGRKRRQRYRARPSAVPALKSALQRNTIPSAWSGGFGSS